jgi:hypothetical protein
MSIDGPSDVTSDAAQVPDALERLGYSNHKLEINNASGKALVSFFVLDYTR